MTGNVVPWTALAGGESLAFGKLAARSQTVPMFASSLPDLAAAEAALAQARRLSRTGLPQIAYSRALGVHEWSRGADAFLEAPEAIELLQADSAQLLAACCFMMASYEVGITFGRTAVAIWDRREVRPKQARAHCTLAWLLAAIGEPDAVTEARAGLDLAEQAGDPREAIFALNTNGMVLWLLKQPERGLPFAREAVALSRRRGRADINALINLAGAEVETALNEREAGKTATIEAVIDLGRELTLEALGLARADGDGWQERLAVCNIAEYEIYAGRFAEAEKVLQDYAHAAGEPTDRCRTHYLHMLGRTKLGQLRYDDAIRILLSSRDIAGRCNDVESMVGIYCDLSRCHAGLGQFQQALEAHHSFHEMYVRQASEAAQRRSRTYALQWEADQLRALAREARQRAEELALTNEMLAQETDRLMRASLEDPLTGLQNRRRLDLAFVELLQSGARFSLAMIDVDHFKQVNDRFSHPVGDAVLREIADILRDGTTEDDLIVRFGGEEFAVLMGAQEPGRATWLCERLRRNVAGHGWSALHSDLAVTVSIGIACSDETSSHDTLVALADFRLYAAKQAGRNRVVDCSEGGYLVATQVSLEQPEAFAAYQSETSR